MNLSLAPEKKVLVIGLALSVVLHGWILSILTGPMGEQISPPVLREVQYIEERAEVRPHLPPKVRRMIAQSRAEAPKPGPKSTEKPQIQPKPSVPEPELPVTVPRAPKIPEPSLPQEQISLERIQELAETQAPLDIQSLEPSLPGEVVDVVIPVGPTSKTTEEILKESPLPSISLEKGKLSGTGGIGPGGGGLPLGSPEGLITLKETLGVVASVKKPLTPPKPEIPSGIPSTSQASTPKVEVRGDIASRVRKKVLPQYPERARREGWEGEVHIHLSVDPSGHVIPSSVVVVQSSGYPDLDQAAKHAALQWVFDPLPPNVLKENQWGVIIFRFVLEF